MTETIIWFKKNIMKNERALCENVKLCLQKMQAELAELNESDEMQELKKYAEENDYQVERLFEKMERDLFHCYDETADEVFMTALKAANLTPDCGLTYTENVHFSSCTNESPEDRRSVSYLGKIVYSVRYFRGDWTAINYLDYEGLYDACEKLGFKKVRKFLESLRPDTVDHPAAFASFFLVSKDEQDKSPIHITSAPGWTSATSFSIKDVVKGATFRMMGADSMEHITAPDFLHFDKLFETLKSRGYTLPTFEAVGFSQEELYDVLAQNKAYRPLTIPPSGPFEIEIMQECDAWFGMPNVSLGKLTIDESTTTRSISEFALKIYGASVAFRTDESMFHRKFKNVIVSLRKTDDWKGNPHVSVCYLRRTPDGTRSCADV